MSSNSKRKRSEACNDGIAGDHLAKRVRSYEADPTLNSRPSRCLSPPERPGSLQHGIEPLDTEDDVEEIPRTEKATYHYTPLRAREFRLLRVHPAPPDDELQCSLFTDSIDTPSSYEALSYVWGTQWPSHHILLSDETEGGFSSPSHFPIGSNLYGALRALRMPSRPLLIWVDALCIDQAKSDERSAQVSMMSEIYQKAFRVLCWLGPSDLSSSHLFSNLHWVFSAGFFPNESKGSRTMPNHELCHSMGEASRDLFSRPYFKRGWVIQELILAKKATAVVGEHQVDFEDLVVAHELFSTWSKSQDMPWLAGDWVADFLHGRDELLRRSSSGDVITRTKSLAKLVLRFRGFQVTDPRDRIYALRSIAIDCERVAVDYKKSVVQVFADFVSTCIQDQGLLDLIMIPWAPVGRSKQARHRRSKVAHEPSTTPSWLASLDELPYGSPEDHDGLGVATTRRVNGDGLVDMPAIYDASCGMKPEASFGPMVKKRRQANRGVTSAHSQTRQEETLDLPVLLVEGIELGTITDLSTRVADGLISRDALELVGIPFNKGCDALHTLPDAMVRQVWRTLVCDRDADRKPAPTRFGLAFKHLFKRLLLSRGLDTVEILEEGDEVDPNTREFVQRVHNMTFNRRIFVSNINKFQENLLGLVPKQARIGDTIALLFGNSVPVVLRSSCEGGGRYMRIVGSAYVDGKMQGEILHEQREGWIDEMAQTFELI